VDAYVGIVTGLKSTEKSGSLLVPPSLLAEQLARGLAIGAHSSHAQAGPSGV